VTAARVGAATTADPGLALLRRLVGDLDAERYTDLELTAATAATPPYQPPLDADGWWPEPVPDLYETAAQLWEDRALFEEAAGTATADQARVASERNGDLSVTYAGPGKATGAAALTPERMRAIARSLRRRSPNRTARTVVVTAASGQRERPVRGGLYPSQLVN